MSASSGSVSGSGSGSGSDYITQFAKVLRLEPGQAAELIAMLSEAGGASNVAMGVTSRFAEQVLRLPLVQTTIPKINNRDVDDKQRYKIAVYDERTTHTGPETDIEIIAQGTYGLVLQAPDGRIIKREHYMFDADAEKYYRRLLNEQLIAIYLHSLFPANSVNITEIYRQYYPDETPLPYDRSPRGAPKSGESAYVTPTLTEAQLAALHASGGAGSAMVPSGAAGESYPTWLRWRPLMHSSTIYTLMEPCGITFERLLKEFLKKDSLTADQMEERLYHWFIKLGELLHRLLTTCNFKHNDLHPKNVMTNKSFDELMIIDCGMANCDIGGRTYSTLTPERGGYDLLIFTMYILEVILPSALTSRNPIKSVKADKLRVILRWFMSIDNGPNIFDELAKISSPVFHQAYP